MPKVVGGFGFLAVFFCKKEWYALRTFLCFSIATTAVWFLFFRAWSKIALLLKSPQITVGSSSLNPAEPALVSFDCLEHLPNVIELKRGGAARQLVTVQKARSAPFSRLPESYYAPQAQTMLDGKARVGRVIPGLSSLPMRPFFLVFPRSLVGCLLAVVSDARRSKP